MKIINLTQHPATAEQAEAGVIDLPPQERQELQRLLTFEELPSALQVRQRAWGIEALAARAAESCGATAAMIGGAPFLMAPLEAALRRTGIAPVYAFSRRESVEEVQPDGSVRKINTFRHAGFVAAG